MNETETGFGQGVSGESGIDNTVSTKYFVDIQEICQEMEPVKTYKIVLWREKTVGRRRIERLLNGLNKKGDKSYSLVESSLDYFIKCRS